MNLIFIVGMFGPLILGSLAFIVVNFMDLSKSTNAMVIMMAGSSGVACYCGITYNIESIRILYDRLQWLADQSIKEFISIYFEKKKKNLGAVAQEA